LWWLWGDEFGYGGDDSDLVEATVVTAVVTTAFCCPRHRAHAQ